MPRKRKKQLLKKSSPTKSAPRVSKAIDKVTLNLTKKWLEEVQNDYQYDDELMEINSDEEASDEFECNLKELEVSLKKIIQFT